MDGAEMEMRVPGLGMYPVILANTELQEVRKGETWLRQSPGRAGAFLGLLVVSVKNISKLFLTLLIGFAIVMLTRHDAAASFAPPA